MNNTLISFFIVLAVALIFLGPIITIWSLNTLFNLNIDYTFGTWLATAWLQMVTVGNVVSAVKKK